MSGMNVLREMSLAAWLWQMGQVAVIPSQVVA
jgi:hypothetical protein